MVITMNKNIKLMVVLSKLNHTFLNKLGKNLESNKMSTSMYTMLAHLNEIEKAKTQKLGEVAVITSGTITHIVSKMIGLKYVIKTQDTNDKRITWVTITDEGRKAFKKVHGEHMIFLDALLSGFTTNEKDKFIEQIKYFGKKIEKQDVL